MRLIAYMKPYAHWVIFALLLVLGLTAFDLYRPMLVGDAIDTFGANGDYDVIIATAIKYAVVLALSFAFNIAQTWILQKTGQNIILQMRKDLYRHIQSLGSRYFDITPVGKLVTRVTNDVEALNEMYSGILVQLFRNIVKIVGLAGVMLVLDVRLAAISFVLMPLVIGLTVLCQKIARNIYRLYRTRLTDMLSCGGAIWQSCRICLSLSRINKLRYSERCKNSIPCHSLLHTAAASAISFAVSPIALKETSLPAPSTDARLQRSTISYSLMSRPFAKSSR